MNRRDAIDSRQFFLCGIEPIGALLSPWLDYNALSSTPGEVAEWSNAPDSKSGIPVSGIVGSNPTLSAKKMKKPAQAGFFIFWVAGGRSTNDAGFPSEPAPECLRRGRE